MTMIALALAFAVVAAEPVAESVAEPVAEPVAESVAESVAVTPSPAIGPEKLLVLDFRDDGVGDSAVRIIRDSLATHLSNDQRLEVLSTEDMQRALDVEAQKSAMGCSADESCLAEIAGALGARLLFYGTVGKLGALYVVNVSLYDAVEQRSVGKETIEDAELSALLPGVRGAADHLVGRRFGEAPVEASSGPNTLLLAGAGVAGLGVVVAAVGGVVAGLAASDVAAKGTFNDKTAAKVNQDLGVYAVVAGAGIAVVGAGVTAVSLME